MTNNRNTIYFRIGSFVITGLILLIIGIIIFGSGILFKRVVYAETYFKESVQGLSEGSPVKYLGMEVGFVKEINSIDNIYPEAKNLGNDEHLHYLYIKIAIFPKFFGGANDSVSFENHIKKHIDSGLRIRLAPLGLTGNSYLELDFLDPNTNPILPISWQPDYCYIPSATSTLSYFTDNAQYIVNELRNIDFKKFFSDLNNLFATTNNLIQRVDNVVVKNNGQFNTSINNLSTITNNLNTIVERMKAYPPSIFFSSPPPKLELNKL